MSYLESTELVIGQKDICHFRHMSTDFFYLHWLRNLRGWHRGGHARI
jgi:hypothetical protein